MFLIDDRGTNMSFKLKSVFVSKAGVCKIFARPMNPTNSVQSKSKLLD